MGGMAPFFRWLAFNAVAIPLMAVVVFVLAEGLSSAVLFTTDLVRPATSSTLAERRHTEYDELLGWINTPDTLVRDMYGPGMDLRTNSQRFRAEHDFDARVAPSRLRMICSGDSFTLGYGVGDHDTWCWRLQQEVPGLETVNMGQGGYGIDQAYLWYKRDAAALEHQFQLLAFVTADFLRMESEVFLGYPKPKLALDGDALVVRNVPVPERGWFAQQVNRLAHALRDLRLVGLVMRFKAWRGGDPEPRPADAEPESWKVAAAMFEDLRDLNTSRGSKLILVYLPTREDRVAGQVDPWRKRVRALAEAAGIEFLDLVEPFRDVPLADVDSLFIPPGRMDYAYAAGHYTAKGNAWVARTLQARLLPLLGPDRNRR